ncbi:Two-component response regulator ARR11 [Platanthera zijinensis]|uniref:Two-component response regulator ARR11 n=1 Tax=Platanthera zijinensis TaxID=2320716 RepID=A0AAP0BLF5_9ASPA
MPDMDNPKTVYLHLIISGLLLAVMSVDGETSRVMKGVQHGACDYLLKPIRMKELRNIWQHVYRKRVVEVKDMEIHDINEERDAREFSDQELCDPAAAKKARVIWSVDLHQKFVNAMDQIGFHSECSSICLLPILTICSSIAQISEGIDSFFSFMHTITDLFFDLKTFEVFLFNMYCSLATRNLQKLVNDQSIQKPWFMTTAFMTATIALSRAFVRGKKTKYYLTNSHSTIPWLNFFQKNEGTYLPRFQTVAISFFKKIHRSIYHGNFRGK